MSRGSLDVFAFGQAVDFLGTQHAMVDPDFIHVSLERWAKIGGAVSDSSDVSWLVCRRKCLVATFSSVDEQLDRSVCLVGHGDVSPLAVGHFGS